MANKEVDRGLKGLGNQLMGAVKEAASVRVRVSCDCGGYKAFLFVALSSPRAMTASNTTTT